MHSIAPDRDICCTPDLDKLSASDVPVVLLLLTLDVAVGALVVGISVGCSVGVSVTGEVVGADNVGPMDNAWEGVSEGCPDCCGDGGPLGASETCALGFDDTLAIVGALVPRRVGAKEGFSVGTAELGSTGGCCVGKEVGVAVGCSVING